MIPKVDFVFTIDIDEAKGNLVCESESFKRE
jgi:hypothetical protein